MVKIYCQNHVVLCDIKKKITISVEQNAPFGFQMEKSLDISLTDDNDLYFLFSVKIFGSDYHKLKENQGLLVEYNAFGNMVADLLAKCLTEESNSSPRYVLQFAETREPHILQIIETTDFRRLTHLAIELTAASDEALKTYLINFIKRTKYENDQLVSRLQTSENTLIGNLTQAQQALNDMDAKLNQLEITYKSNIDVLKKEHQQELENQLLSYNKDLETLEARHTAECETLGNNHNKVVTKLEVNVEKQLTEIKELRFKNEDMIKELESLRPSVKNKEIELTDLKKELAVLKEQLLTTKDESDNLNAIKVRLSTKSTTLEYELQALQSKVADLESNLAHKKEQTRHFEDEIQRKIRSLDKLEKALKHQTAEVSKANSIIKQLQKDLKNTQTKAKLRGQVATEQEKVLTSRESELEELQKAVDELKTQLKEEHECRKEADYKLSQANASLEEAKQTIESNENMISWLNRQISESYSLNLNQRLQASGVPILPSSTLSNFDGVSTRVSNGKPGNIFRMASDLTSTASVLRPTSPKSIYSMRDSKFRPFVTATLTTTTTTTSPNCPKSYTNENSEDLSEAHGNLYLLSESSSARPLICLSSAMGSKPLVSKASLNSTTTTPNFDLRTTASYQKPPTSIPSFQTRCQGVAATGKTDINYNRHKTGDRKSSSPSFFTEEKSLQSISSAYFPPEKAPT